MLGALISFAGSWNPSYWGDEAASVMSAERSLPSLFQMLGHVDAVHGTYYLFLHFWIEAFGTSELATRLPSALAVGLATMATAVLARRLFTARVAVVAALVFAVLPRVTFMGAEARSTAMATACAVWLTVLLVQTLRMSASPSTSIRMRRGLWAAYAALGALGIYVFLYLVLLIPIHALAVWLWAPNEHRRALWRSWLKATGSGILLAAPVVVFGLAQHEQISFIGTRPQPTLLTALVSQWFDSAPVALAAWALITVAVAVVIFSRHPLRGFERPVRPALVVMLAWIVVPTAALLIGTFLVAPMYIQRYLSFCTPAVAIVIAVGIVCLGQRWLQAGALLLLVALVAPDYLSQRTSFAKDGGSDWRQTAAVVAANAHPGDAVIFDDSTRPSRLPRLALRLYPAAFTGLQDVTLATSFQQTAGLWDVTVPLASVTEKVASTRTAWILENVGSTEAVAATDVHELENLGFVPALTETVNRTTIIEMTR
ncbi:glycosyltransferase family 39 protein [Leifsonia kafniensis]|uniref:Glycosyltransferase family 39 protein n=1 Tax=Leifsonia kafniensis TaxID=475957 RepID=A0ABP7KDG5_9MICO